MNPQPITDEEFQLYDRCYDRYGPDAAKVDEAYLNALEARRRGKEVYDGEMQPSLHINSNRR